MDWDIEELACFMMGKTEAETEEILNNGTVDDLLYDKYGIGFDTYCAIVKHLLPFTPVVTSELLGTKYHAFVNGDCCIVRLEVVETVQI